MKVGIDARALLSERTGIGVYTAHIAAGLSAQPGVEVTLFAPRAIGSRAGIPSRVRSRTGRHAFGTLWVQTHLARELAADGCDVLLSAVTIAPARIGLPYVSVVHDLTPISHPEWHRRRTVVAFLPWIERTLAGAERVIAVSRSTAAEIAARFPEIRGKTIVIEHGVDPRFSPSGPPGESEAVRAEFTRGRRFFLYLGTLEPRKNVGALIAACERLWRERRGRPDLLLAGSGGWKSEGLLARIARSPFRDKIHRIGWVPADSAPALLRAAEVFCYPSHAEGFGLPVLEAMACGTPAVVSTAPALREVAGDAAFAVPPTDPAALADALARVLEDDELRRRLADRGVARASRFRWSTAAERTAAVLREATSGNGAPHE
ncbi:MAG TPA: glycosyltransferase family 1 protein [Thermoanaerobaculia bacterium]|nr:glycosyltransferase family 1 protein [Thermoanaerobaculia bacterium]